LFYFGKTRSYNSKVVNYYYDRKEKDMNEIFNNINEQLDKNRVDEWHCTIPLSEDGGVMADDLVDTIGPGGLVDGYIVVIDEERRGFTEADVIGTTVIQSKDYIYHILKIGDGHGFSASITRINQNAEEI
tara:strand:- start:246 stop:635 length:390 start_codon:yes stop_codon:yes gene_type:complete